MTRNAAEKRIIQLIESVDRTVETTIQSLDPDAPVCRHVGEMYILPTVAKCMFVALSKIARLGGPCGTLAQEALILAGDWPAMGK